MLGIRNLTGEHTEINFVFSALDKAENFFILASEQEFLRFSKIFLATI